VLTSLAEAAISNPNNSEEAKERAQDRLQEMEQSGELDSSEAHAAQVERGHKVGRVFDIIPIDTVLTLAMAC
jgi:hypothetical protein